MQILLKFKLYPFKMNFELKSSQVQQLVRTMGLFFSQFGTENWGVFSFPVLCPLHLSQYNLV